jgi:hypothetical protein
MNRAAPFSPPCWPVVIPRIVAHDAQGLVAFLREVFGATGAWTNIGAEVMAGLTIRIPRIEAITFR